MEVATTLDYLGAPSSPRRFGQCFSTAPASPNTISESFYHQFDDLSMQNRVGNCSVHDPGLSTDDGYDFDFDFAFDVSAVSEKESRSADELFSGGKIRPLTPELEEVTEKPTTASPKPPIVVHFLRQVFSPRRKKQREAKTEDAKNRGNPKQSIKEQSCWSDEKATLTCSSSSKVSSSSSSKRWSLSNLMLFRSASEGRGSDNLKKYAARSGPDVKNESFRSTTAATGSRRRASAHEMHYAANRAASEDLKKRTFLPYNQAIFAVHGFGSLTR